MLGGAGRVRTADLPVANGVLWPAELQPQSLFVKKNRVAPANDLFNLSTATVFFFDDKVILRSLNRDEINLCFEYSLFVDNCQLGRKLTVSAFLFKKGG